MSIRPVKRLIKSKPTLEGAGVHLRRAFGFGNTSDFDPRRGCRKAGILCDSWDAEVDRVTALSSFSALSARLKEKAPGSYYPPATVKPWRFIWRKSRLRSRPARRPPSS